jgi:AraC-like DNA-binding protein
MLAEYLRFLATNQNLDVVISDMSGFLTAHEALNRVLQPYLNHMNSYCMYVKANQTLWARCIILKEKLMLRCSRSQGLFFGTCHCGVGEYVLPLRTRFGLSGFISATGYRSDPAALSRRLPAAARRYQLNEQDLQKLYDQSMRQTGQDDLSGLVGLHLPVVALLLNQVIDAFWSREQDATMDNQRQSMRLIARAMDYMNEMYAHVTDLDEIARYCNISKSHLQHLFQSCRKQSVWETLQTIRMEEARRLLTETDHPVSLLASMVGYNDANYFSTVFARENGMPPRRYRQHNRQTR